jgi:hypothetical protein
MALVKVGLIWLTIKDQWREGYSESGKEISGFKCCLSAHVDNYTIIVPTKCTSFY